MSHSSMSPYIICWGGGGGRLAAGLAPRWGSAESEGILLSGCRPLESSPQGWRCLPGKAPPKARPHPLGSACGGGGGGGEG